MVVAKRIGSGNKSLANKAVMTAILLSLVGGFILMTVGVVFAEKFLITTNCPDTLLKAATLYFKRYFYGIPILMLYNFCAAILRATGDTKRPMYYLLFGGTFGAFSAIFSGQLSAIMSSTPAVIEFSRQKMIIISSTYFICGINEVMCGVLRGMGKPILPTVATLIYMCILRFVWVYAIFPLFPNLTFLYLVWPIGWILSIITLFIVYIPAISKLKRQLDTEKSV